MLYFNKIKEVRQMKTLKLVLIILLVISVAGLSYAASTSNITPANKTGGKAVGTSRGAGIKAERGIKNILFGWTEIPKSIIQVTKDTKNPLWGLTAGTFKGIGKAFPRTISGVSDVVSFPMADYNKSPVKTDELKTQVQ